MGIKNYNLALCSFMLTIGLHAQRVLMPDDIREYWKTRTDTVSLETYDRIDTPIGWESVHLMKSNALSKAEDIELPPSVWICYEKQNGENLVSNSDIEGEGKILCWIGLAKEDSVNEKKLRDKLKRRYGVLRDQNGREGIPALWVTDCLHTVVDAKYRWGLWIGGVYTSRDVCFRKGVFCEYDEFFGLEDDDDHSTWDVWYSSFDDDTCAIRIDTDNKYEGYSLSDISYELFESYSMSSTQDNVNILSHTDMKTIRKFRLHLLANNLALLSPRQNPPKEQFIHNVPIFIYELPDGRVRMEVIGDETYTEAQQRELKILAHAFSRMPRGSCISHYYTSLEGLIFGELLYVSSICNYWILSDAP